MEDKVVLGGVVIPTDEMFRYLGLIKKTQIQRVLAAKIRMLCWMCGHRDWIGLGI